MKYLILLLITATIHSTESIIDAEAKKLSGLWTNGSFIPLKLTKEATIDSLILGFQNAYQESNQEWRECKVLDHKQIKMAEFDGLEYIVILVRHSKGNAIIYLRYEEQSNYWWNKSFPIK